MNHSHKVAIWGFGKEGQSLYNVLKNDYNDITILSDNPLPQDFVDAPVLIGQEAIKALKAGHFDLIFKSPGVSLYRPEIVLAKEKGTQFSSATNLWFENNQKTKKIVITGTKGKSTTASLLYHVMGEMGLSVSLGGNIGVPLIDVKEETEYTVIELSSYQLADLQYPPELFVITNLFPEHLQWHETHENYFNDKLSPLRLEQDFPVIANTRNEILKEKLSYCSKDITWFNDQEHEWIETRLKGDHNQENIRAVLAICDFLKLDLTQAQKYVRSFSPLVHRMQEFTAKNGFTCVNDSISTTPQSALAAMKTYPDQSIILILGGTDRGQDYSDLIDYIQKRSSIKAVLLLPSNGKRIEKECNAAGLTDRPVLLFAGLEELSEWVKENAESKDIVLLSPAAPSHDQFKNFEERGNFFMQLMKG